MYIYRYVHDPFGRVLQRTRTSVVTQLHVKVQSNRRRGPTQAITAGMFERVSIGRRTQKVWYSVYNFYFRKCLRFFHPVQYLVLRVLLFHYQTNCNRTRTRKHEKTWPNDRGDYRVRIIRAFTVYIFYLRVYIWSACEIGEKVKTATAHYLIQIGYTIIFRSRKARTKKNYVLLLRRINKEIIRRFLYAERRRATL